MNNLPRTPCAFTFAKIIIISMEFQLDQNLHSVGPKKERRKRKCENQQCNVIKMHKSVLERHGDLFNECTVNCAEKFGDRNPSHSIYIQQRNGNKTLSNWGK